MTSWRAAAFGAVHHTARLLERAGRGLRYVGAGLLDPPAFRTWAERTWHDFAASERDVMVGLAAWERAFYSRFLRRGERVLLVGSGSGRDLIGLLDLGCRAEGLDLSAPAVARARELLGRRGVDARLRVGDVTDAPLDGPYDAIVFSAQCYGYLPMSAGRIAVLRRLGAALAPGGRILLSVSFVEDATWNAALRTAALGARLTRAGWAPEPGDRVHGFRGGLLFEHEFAPGELEREAAAGGLAVVFRDDREGTAVLEADVSRASAPAGTP